MCPPHPSGGNFGRTEAALADLTVSAGGAAATTRFFGEEQLIAHDDATWTDAGHPAPVNGLNNASHIEMTVSGTATNYTFALFGSTQRSVPAIQHWKQIDPAVAESSVVVAGEGRYIVCSKATSLGGTPPMWHYEYAVWNMNSDRSGGTFSVPIDDGATVTNIEFHAVLYRGGDGNGGANFDGTPWPASRAAGVLTWATQPQSVNNNANAIRWSNTYNFRFDANVAPAASNGSVTLGLWKPGTPSSIAAPAQIPSPGCVPPTITAHPVQASECYGNTAVFSVTAAGTAPLDYRWQIEVSPGVWSTMGNDPMPLPCGGGAFAFATSPFSNQSPIGVHPCAGVSQYQIRATVTNSCGSATSNPATLTVVTTSAGDVNADGTVDGDDINPFEALLGRTGPPSPGFCAADLNKSGQIDAVDVSLFVTALLGT